MNTSPKGGVSSSPQEGVTGLRLTAFEKRPSLKNHRAPAPPPPLTLYDPESRRRNKSVDHLEHFSRFEDSRTPITNSGNLRLHRLRANSAGGSRIVLGKRETTTTAKEEGGKKEKEEEASAGSQQKWEYSTDKVGQ